MKITVDPKVEQSMGQHDGITGGLSWASLAELMKRDGILMKNEKVHRFHIDDIGITFFVEYIR